MLRDSGDTGVQASLHLWLTFLDMADGGAELILILEELTLKDLTLMLEPVLVAYMKSSWDAWPEYSVPKIEKMNTNQHTDM